MEEENKITIGAAMAFSVATLVRTYEHAHGEVWRGKFKDKVRRLPGGEKKKIRPENATFRV